MKTASNTEVIQKAKVILGLDNDNQLAIHLGVARQHVWNFKALNNSGTLPRKLLDLLMDENKRLEKKVKNLEIKCNRMAKAIK